MLTISLSRSVWTLTGALSWGPWGAATPIKTVESNWHFSWHRGMKSLARHHWSVPFSNLNLCTVRLNALQCTSKENAEHKGSTNNNNEETTNPMKRPQIKSKCCFALRKRSCKKNHIWVTSIQPKYPPPCQPTRQTLLPKCYWRQREVMHLGWLYMWICLRDKNLNGEIIYECNWPNLDLKTPMKTMTLALAAIGRC